MSIASAERAPRVTTWTRVLVAALLVLAVLATYEGVRRCGFTDADDPHYVLINRHVRAGLTLDGLRWAMTTGHAANWHPLTWLSHMLDVELFGLAPLGHHATSVLLHAANTVLLLLALERMTRSFWRSAAVAALFALHPLRVESVAWVAERKDVLCAFFFFAMLLAYVSYVEQPSRRRFTLVALAFALGLLAKPMLVTAPFALLLLDAWPLRRHASTRWSTLVREKWPLFALSVASSVATYLAQSAGGAVQAIDAISLPVRALNAVLSYGHYLQHTFWPAGLCFYYPYPRSSQLVPLFGSIASIAAISWYALRQRATRPYLLVGWLWFLGLLVPVIGLVQVGSQAYADRYTYLPALGVLIAIVWLCADGLARLRAPSWVSFVATAAVVAPLASLAHRQVSYWSDSVTLFQRAVDVTRDNSFAHQCLGNALTDRGRIDAGIEQLREALRLSPNFAYAHNGLGAALYTQGKLDEADQHLQRAIELMPAYFEPHFNRGLLLVARGRFEEARAMYARAVELDRDNNRAHGQLAKTLGSLGRLDEALAHYRVALALQPGDIEVRRFIAITLTLLDRIEEAIAEYEALLRASPADVDALNNIAWMRATHARAEHRSSAQAIEYAERARALLPVESAMLLDTLAAAYAEAGRFDDARATCERAIELAATSGDEGMATRFRGHLELFKSGQPLRGR